VTIPLRVGFPIRTSTDQRLLAAPHGFSQRATSFIASWCQGIHRMPFSCSRAPPCTETILRGGLRTAESSAQHTTGPSHPLARTQWTFHASERFTPSHGHPQTPGQTLRRQRPETHQNLIYPDKEQRPRGAQTVPQARIYSVHSDDTDYFRFSAIHAPNPPPPLVETIGFEPTTPCLQSRCSPS
jgi:hypothetical protein